MVAAAQIFGVGLMAAGVFLWSVPAGLVFAGLATVMFAVAWEKGR
jgi:hypothetical protein